MVVGLGLLWHLHPILDADGSGERQPALVDRAHPGLQPHGALPRGSPSPSLQRRVEPVDLAPRPLVLDQLLARGHLLDHWQHQSLAAPHLLGHHGRSARADYPRQSAGRPSALPHRILGAAHHDRAGSALRASQRSLAHPRPRLGQGVLGQPILAGSDFCTQPRRRSQLPIPPRSPGRQQSPTHRPLAVVLGRNRRPHARPLLADSEVVGAAKLKLRVACFWLLVFQRIPKPVQVARRKCGVGLPAFHEAVDAVGV